MSTAIASTRVTHRGQHWRVELREDPLRIDVWWGVVWVGQWAWSDGKFGQELSTSRHRLLKGVQELIEAAVHELDMGAYAPSVKGITKKGARAVDNGASAKLEPDEEKMLLIIYVLSGGRDHVPVNQANMRLMWERFTTGELTEMARRIKAGEP